MKKFVMNFVKNESGVTSVEYALLAAAAAGVFTVAGANFYEKINGALNDILPTSSGDSSTF